MKQSKSQVKNEIYIRSRFFVPSILNWKGNNKLYLLCLSTGNASGQGRVRTKELEKSCRYLGFAEGPTVIDDPDLQQGQATEWSEEMVAD